MYLILRLLVVFSLIFITAIPSIAQDNPAEEYINTYKDEIGTVLNVSDDYKVSSLNAFHNNQKAQKVKVRIDTGDLSGKEYVLENMSSGNPAYDIKVKANDKVLVTIEDTENEKQEIYISNNYRMTGLMLLLIVFIIVIIIFGGIKGVKSLISLIFTYFLIFYFLIPNILNGYPPILLTIIICIVATCGTITVISGFNLKTLGAIIGTGGGVILAGMGALMTIELAKLNGFPNEHAIGLWMQHSNLDFKGILASGMIIGALGASMDVGMSIASSIQEVKNAAPDKNIKDLIKSGFNVGKDIMGTMTNTLLLAYTGSAIFLLLIVNNNISWMKFFNLNSIASEITAALAGSLGLIMCIPITAVSTSYLLSLKKTKVG